MIPVQRSTVLRGTGLGGAAFVLGYVLTWILAGAKASTLAVTGPFGGAIAEWRAVLWLVYDSHFVGIRTPRVFGPDGGLWGGGELVDTVALLDVEYLYVLPVLLLVVAGGLAATLADASTPRAGLVAGIQVSLGYLLLVVVGLFLATQAGTAPSPLRALVIAGIVYPVAFGGLGGTLAARYGRASTDRPADTAH